MTQLIDSMVTHGVPRVQAIALALSIETFMVNALLEFLEAARVK